MAKTVAVLMASYNRKMVTLRCLSSLFAQALPAGMALKVFLTDDQSKDGTAEAVRAQFPQVEIVSGNGSLFWAGATEKSWQKAIPSDFYLWLNDDVELHPGALANLLSTYSQHPDSLITGTVANRSTGLPSYGGRKVARALFRFDFVGLSQTALPCETMNGNLVLIPDSSRKKIGTLDSHFIHNFADYDYGLRATKQGVPVWAAPGIHGVCDDNSFQGSYRDPSLPLAVRWKLITGPKGLPLRVFWHFTREHAPFPQCVYWLAPYVKALLGFAGRTS